MHNSAQDICRFHYSQMPSIMCNVKYVVVVLVEMDSLS